MTENGGLLTREMVGGNFSWLLHIPCLYLWDMWWVYGDNIRSLPKNSPHIN